MPPHHIAPPTSHAGAPPTGEPPTGELPRVRTADEARAAAKLLLPALAEGLIQRRRWAMATAERYQTDRRAIDMLRDLRARYGAGPLWLPARGRSLVLLLDSDDLARVLAETPDPFSPSTWEKRRALGRFQPHGSLISRGAPREARRHLNELALDTPHPLHRVAPAVAGRVCEEAANVAERSATAGGLDWDAFAAGWWRSVRRIVLGDAARDDDDLTDRLAGLRAAGSWSLPHPRLRLARAEYLVRLQRYAFQAGADTLAGQLHMGDTDVETDPVGQVPHWLFAFDAAGIVTLRALALLAGHPEAAARARAELTGADLAGPEPLPFLRACVLESVRLWPTTPVLLREGTEPTRWRDATVPAGTAFAAFTPYFHRAEPSGPHGDGFAPDIWLDGRAERNPALVPFSAGPAACPGENVVLLTASTWLGVLLSGRTFTLDSRMRPHPREPVPATLNHFGLRFSVSRG
ncbi:cytochrome P450 [Streptomyces sp. NBC_01803]|uniref:cytochrome P450 n=1 Tax=Streptomyces sp. NBC_01803 TaxID=2975946 RepID=UPI002DDBCC9D|nr:cytochrome P450 [Streptomyces sp. NBC_01803]WSA43413.1 cytochrome P450 [Streptomyces sp. NBC_01803]